MKIHQWEKFLCDWNRDWMEALEKVVGDAELSSLEKEAYDSGSLMYPPSAVHEISVAEKKLGISLPPSYRSFLLVTNGWRQLGLEVEDARILPVNKIELYKDVLPERMNIEGRKAEDYILSDDIYLDYDKNHGVDNERYYGLYRGCYWDDLVIISEEVQDLRYLLNPKVINNEGDWEAWNYSYEDGVLRYPSFWELMKAEREKVKIEVILP